MVFKDLVKLSVKSLVTNSRIKPEAIIALISTLGNEGISNEEWESFFNSQGANIGINEGIYSLNIFKALTLRAIFLPETLLEYYRWYMTVAKKNKEIEKERSLFLDFQNRLREAILNEASDEQIDIFQDKLEQGLTVILAQLLAKKTKPIQVLEFLNQAGHLWKNYLSEMVKRYLKIIPEYKNSLDDNQIKSINEIWQVLIKKVSRLKVAPEYLPVAQLFKLLQEYHLAAYFYQISIGFVPKNIFIKAGFPLSIYSGQLYDLKIKRRFKIIDELLLIMLTIIRFTFKIIIFWVKILFYFFVIITLIYLVFKFIPVWLIIVLLIMIFSSTS